MGSSEILVLRINLNKDFGKITVFDIQRALFDTVPVPGGNILYYCIRVSIGVLNRILNVTRCTNSNHLSTIINRPKMTYYSRLPLVYIYINKQKSPVISSFFLIGIVFFRHDTNFILQHTAFACYEQKIYLKLSNPEWQQKNTTIGIHTLSVDLHQPLIKLNVFFIYLSTSKPQWHANIIIMALCITIHF
jgi:hypothetical protein